MRSRICGDAPYEARGEDTPSVNSRELHFGGVETYKYNHNYLEEDCINPEKLKGYLRKLLINEGKKCAKIWAMEKLKTYAFIDSQNLNLGVRSQGWMLDFSRFRVLLKEKYNVEKAFLFIGFMPDNQKLYTSLQKDGYLLIFKPVLEIGKRKDKKEIKIKGNIDAELVLHSMIEFPNYDKAVIVSGDGDFYCLVEYLSDQRKLEKVIVPNKKYSSLLRKFSLYIVNIELFKDKLKK